MLLWLSQNWGSILVVLILIAAVIAILSSFLRARKQGKSSCGCSCSDCAMCGRCRKQGS